MFKVGVGPRCCAFYLAADFTIVSMTQVAVNVPSVSLRSPLPGASLYLSLCSVRGLHWP